MKLRFLDRLLSLGQSDQLPDRLARHIRVTNALALLGVVLSLVSAPLDAFGAPVVVSVTDVTGAAAFAACWWLNARGRYTSSRVALVATANVVIFTGVIELGPFPELRTVFFPLVLMPFLVLGTSERRWLALFVVLPIVAYFVTGAVQIVAPGFATTVYMVYAPVLAFVTIIAGSSAFALVDRNAEAKLLQARAREAEGARLVALGELSGGIAHEIRNPLAAIHLAATHIVDQPTNAAQVKELGERIQRIVMRATRITDALRSFARDASGDPFVTAPVERIIGDSLELCGKRLTEHGVVLTVGPVPSDLAIECRPVQLTQVLVNLLGNSYDSVAAAADRWVRIDVNTDREGLELAVTDSGPGIPATARQRIFEPFFTTKAPDRGTGLGLSLSRGLVEAHHGTLELDDKSPRTRFVMRLPLTQPRALGEA